MAVREILQIGHPTLRKHSHKVMRFGNELATLAEDMLETMRAANGVGLAAPQIGILTQLIVIEMPDDDDYPHPGEQFILCNPKVVKASRETEAGTEGCLSVQGYVGQVERPVSVIIEGQNVQGKKVRIKAEDYLARVFLHEIDHLDGVLYVDIAQKDSIISNEELEKRREQETTETTTAETAEEHPEKAPLAV